MFVASVGDTAISSDGSVDFFEFLKTRIQGKLDFTPVRQNRLALYGLELPQ